MSRKYTKMDGYEKQILTMKKAGKTQREIAESLGLEREQIKEWFRRYRCKQSKNRSRRQDPTERQTS